MNSKPSVFPGIAFLALCALAPLSAASAAPLPASRPTLSARPVDSIVAKLLLPSHGIVPAEFRPGTIRLRMASGSIDLDLAELQSVRYRAAIQLSDGSDADADECTIVTVRNDLLVGSCPYREFRRLLKASGPDKPDVDAVPAAITFPGNAAPPETEPGRWTVKLDNGSLLRVRPASEMLRLEDSNGAFSLPAALVASIVRDSVTNLLAVHLADIPFALQCHLPRGSFESTFDSDRTVSFPWSEISAIATPASSANATGPAKTSQNATATFRSADGTPDATIPLPGGFPVTMLSLDTSAGIMCIPSTRIARISRNPDHTHTVVTVAGDILTAKLALPDLDVDIGGSSASIASAVSIDFKECTSLPLPADALVWRLASGDVIIATRANPESAASVSATVSKSAAPSAGRISAVHAPAAAPSILPQPAADGAWPEKRYSIQPLATATPIDIPSKLLDTVRLPPVASLPPATIPAGPSAQATDEIVFPGGVFTLGRAHGDGPADETPAVSIRIAPFAMANTPVTVAQFRAFVDDTGYSTTAELMSDPITWKNPGFAQTDDDPVVCVSWIDAAQYCNWRSKRARLTPAYAIRDGGYNVTLDLEADGYRLPLEAEWEYAARNGGQDILFPWGSTDPDDESAAMALSNFTSIESPLDPWPNTNPVKAFPAAPSGLYGMAGNVWEWCQDMYDAKSYVSAYRVGEIMPLLNPDPRDYPNGHISRVIRGGSFKNPLFLLRCTTRARGFSQQVGRPHVGMRVVRNAD